MPTDRFIRDKAAIRAELERLARARRVVTYGEAAALVGRSTAALMPVLAAIRADDARRGRPDLTCLVVAVWTGLPRGIDRDRAVAEQEAVFRAWAARCGPEERAGISAMKFPGRPEYHLPSNPACNR